MKQQQIARLYLQTQIWATSKGWSFWLASALMILSAAVGLLITPSMTQRIDNLTAVIAQQSSHPLLKEPPGTVRPAARGGLTSTEATFYGLLVDEDADDKLIQHIFRLAAQQSLTLADVSYRYALNADGRFMEMTIETPIKGPYSQIVRFCENVLETLPNAALDTLDFKREHINDNEVEAKARFAIYMKPATRKPARPSQ